MNLGRSACLALAMVFPLSLSVAAEPDKETQSAGKFETSLIEKAIGRPGELKGEVYKISLPRTDLDVKVKEVRIKPAFALSSWVAFKPAGELVIMDGDLVLTEKEVPAVVRIVQTEGLEITALHNHLLGETPRVMYLHVAGRGDALRLAASVKKALNATNTPTAQAASKTGEVSGNIVADDVAFDATKIETVLGHKGQFKNGVLSISVPRSEPVKLYGVALPPTMGTATALNFQAGEDKDIVATGDFVMTRNEVNEVIKVLTENGIVITALHNHLVHGTPDLYFMHFWANDTPEKVTRGLKAGLDAIRLK